MKKLLIINTEYKQFGGEDANIIEELAFFAKKYEVKYIKFSNKNKLKLRHLIAFFTGSNYLSNKIVKDAIVDFKPNYIYIHNTWFDANIGIFKTILKTNIPIFLKIHNFRFDCARYFLTKNHLNNLDMCNKCSMDNTKNKIFNKYFLESTIKSFLIILYSKKYFKLLKSGKLQILCLTKFQKNYIKSLGVGGGNLHIFENPTPISLANNLYNFNSNYVVYAGRIDKSKGVEDLLASWINVDLKGLTLKIIGQGNQLKYLKKKYSSGNVEFLGYLPNSETLNLMKSSRAVITATKMYEGQPRMLTEASINGIPSIFPDFGGMKEFFPQDYQLSFDQFNYEDLESKIILLKNQQILEKCSNDVFEFINKNMNDELMYSNFKNITNSVNK